MAIDPSSSSIINPSRSFSNPNPNPNPNPNSSLTRPNLSSQLFHHSPPPRIYSAQPLPLRIPYNPPQLPKPHDAPTYPLASSGRGFVPHKSLRPVADQTVTVANHAGAGFPPRSPGNFHAANHQVAKPVPQYFHHVTAKGVAIAVPVPVPQKVVASPVVPESNGYKDTRERSKDDMLAVVRDRKVRITEGASLYALCRSWLRNGLHEEHQPQYGDAVRSLPKPLPLSVATGNLKEEGEEKDDADDSGEEENESVEQSAEDLFRGHVKRAKKVRARLREARLRQIERYKLRLALLLPPLVEQFRNDTAAAGT